MTLQWTHTLRLSLCAAALAVAGFAQAQTPSPPPAPAVPAPMVHPHAADHKAGHKAEHPKPHHKSDSKAHDKSHNKAKHHHKASKHGHGTPAQHEAAAVRHEERHGMPLGKHDGANMTEFERNALRRCDVFKTNEDRHACAERVRNPQINGSVQDGGLIREHTQQMQQPMPAAPAR